jgi:hypothetical protein
VAATQPTATTTMAAVKIANPTQLLSSRAANMWLRLRNASVAKTIVTWVTMKNRKYTSTRKCSDRAAWMLNRLLITVRRIDSAGDIPSPVMTASGAAMKTVVK